jgi:PAP2 superfamily
LLKHLFSRSCLGILSYPSGHAANLFALTATVSVLLLWPPQPVRTWQLRVLLTAAAGMLAVMVAIGVIGQRFHYFTDTVAGAAVGIGTVCGLALVLDLPIVARQLARVRRRLPTAQVDVPIQPALLRSLGRVDEPGSVRLTGRPEGQSAVSKPSGLGQANTTRTTGWPPCLATATVPVKWVN